MTFSLVDKNDCNLFMFGSSSKKRPGNLVLGRLFEHELLDMVELGINEYKGLSEFQNEKIGTSVKPCLVFNGPKWNQTEEMRRLKSLFIDAFHRDTVSNEYEFLLGRLQIYFSFSRWMLFVCKVSSMCWASQQLKTTRFSCARIRLCWKNRD